MTDLGGKRAKAGILAASIAGAAFLILIGLLALSPAIRSEGDAFLLAFRVQEKAAPLKIIVAPVPQPSASAAGQDPTDSRTLSSMIHLQLTGGQQVAAVEDAQALLTFNLERLSRFPRPSAVTVYEHGTAQASLESGAALQLTRSLSGREVNLPPAVTDTIVQGTVNAAVRQRWETLGLSLTYWQLLPPHLETVTGPSIDLLRSQLAQAYLAVNPQVGQQLLRVQNWDETIVVPVPPGARQRAVKVNRQPATLVESSSLAGPDSFLIWQNRGVLNYLHAPVTGDQLLIYAQSVSGGG